MSMTGQQLYDYILRDFKRTDKTTEVYEAITDTIRDMKLRFEFDEAKTEKNATTAVTVLGNYSFPIESDLGLLIGDIILRDGTNSYPMNPCTKDRLDHLYPNPGASNALRGRPKYYTLFGGNVLLGPVPDSTSYQYHISYAADDGSSIASGTNAVPFTLLYREVLKFGALSRLYYALKNNQEGMKNQTLYETQLLTAIRREKKNFYPIGATEYRGF